MKTHKPAAVAAHQEPVQTTKPPLQRPVAYKIEHHLIRIFESPEYLAAAKGLGLTPEAFQNDVVRELKAIIAVQQAQELADYEQAHGPRALAAAVYKLKAQKAA